MFGRKKGPKAFAAMKGPQTQLITGAHSGDTKWRLLRWFMFLAALLSVVCGGFLLTIHSVEKKVEYKALSIDIDVGQAKNIALNVAAAFRKYWIPLIIVFAAVFTFFELFIHSRWKIYLIYALISIAAWAFTLYSLNMLELPIEELRKGIGGG